MHLPSLFSRPFGTYPGTIGDPALKRWAIFNCPFGTSLCKFPKGIAASTGLVQLLMGLPLPRFALSVKSILPC